MSALTGIPGLLADPSLEGGGMHQTEPGGFLNVHADFTMHHHQTRWHRRVNLILYLNEDWQDAWGGQLELWDRAMASCVTKIPPILNRAAIFNTDETSFHGYPDPIRFPAGPRGRAWRCTTTRSKPIRTTSPGPRTTGRVQPMGGDHRS